MTITYREAVRIGMRTALQRDPRVFLMGEDVGKYGGTYACSKGFLDEFGPERIRDTPLSESTFVGAGIGAALGGMRPIVEVMTVNFSLLALDQIMNNAATITVTSLGEQGVETVFGVIYPPQVALVGFGKVVERPWVTDGQVVPRPVVTASLSADHRVSDGHRGGLFLADLDRRLQEPQSL